MEDIDRFWSHVDQSGGPDACWPWTLSCNEGGYGKFYPACSSGLLAHRWLLGHLRGKPLVSVPRGLEDACHRCDNPPCCNPAHLYVGTRKQNVGDAVERSRLWMLKKDVCPRGHAYDKRKPNGARRCSTCERLADRRTERRTHCRNRHPLAGDNVILCKNGTRKCRTCDKARVAASQARRGS